jgi:hypothetical protein
VKPPIASTGRRRLTDFAGLNVWSFGMPEGGTSLQDWWDYGESRLWQLYRQWEALHRPTGYQSSQIRTLRTVL